MAHVLRIGLALWLFPGCSAIFGLEPPAPIRQDAQSHDDARDGRSLDAPPTDAPIDLVCPGNYMQVATTGTYYRFVTAQASWLGAATDCADDDPHTHLVVITSDQERMLAFELGGSSPGWIGLSDLASEGSYRWVTAEPTSYPLPNSAAWSNGEPSNDASQDCVTFNGQGELKDDPCGFGRPYLCECDGYPDDPTRY